ncbi:MAG: aminopeptidase N [Pseudomonadota bacterium]
MRTDTAQTIRLSDYQPPAHWVETVHLTFTLSPTATRVVARITFVPNGDLPTGQALHLHGKDLHLIRASINGTPLDPNSFTPRDEGIEVPASLLPDGPFEWAAETEISPETNTSLEGLYTSGGMYCTQCEAEGFRKITYYPDRPDVMAVFTVRIEGDAPVMLSNGNPTAQGPGWAEWHDPWPKPAYLFALVAGDLVSVDDSFTTASGRKVALKIYVRPGNEGKCAYAMDALKRSMRWDETEYGREYDLDLFMIVAVDDFNMGAMENKGLNIFNSKYVLASPSTATDRDYEFIEGIVAHEYFHNWTGNRITCRDWFQLCLKEGLTVFRDQQFSGDARGHAVKRIDDVLTLRARQFREDAGPLAHPVRPEEYIEINNFYTATVYEKGAEVIGMLRTLVGAETYAGALDLYFERHDGQACTIEDWLAVFEAASGRDLSQFKLWYSQAGTPKVTVRGAWDGADYVLSFSQRTDPTPGQPDKAPLVIPVAFGLLGEDGADLVGTQLVTLTEASQVHRIAGLTRQTITPSLLRGFSAPVILDHGLDAGALAHLLAHDSDPFNRWEAAQRLMLDRAVALVHGREGTDPGLSDGLVRLASDQRIDPATRALLLALPSEETIATQVHGGGHRVDPDAVHAARRRMEREVAQALDPAAHTLFAEHAVHGPYRPDASDAGSRALRARMLGYISALEDTRETARAAFQAASNMTEQMSALIHLADTPHGAEALAAFYDQWQDDRLVIDKWFSVQASRAAPATGVETVTALAEHPAFEWKNPNRFRSLVGAFASGNPAAFHRADGAGYAWLANWLLVLDPVNPQTTARLAGLFETWRRYDDPRQALIVGQLQRIADAPSLSKDTREIIERILEA